MEKEFVSYEIALKLKELGFDEPCFTYYYELTSNLRTHLGVDINNAWTYSGNKKLGFTLAPLYQQVFRWFRENYDLRYNIDYVSAADIFKYELWIKGRIYKYNTYEEAELACLQKMIEIIENK